MRADMRDTEDGWPPYVFLPYAGWYAATCMLLRKSRLDRDDIYIMQAMSVVGTWRLTQDVVRFDKDVYASVVDTPLDGDIPFDMLYRLPAWCVYVETQSMKFRGVPVSGFWALLEHDVNDGQDELRLYYLTQDALMLLPIVMRFGTGSLRDAIQRVIDSDIKHNLLSSDEADAFTEEHKIEAIPQAINLLLYVCAYGFPGRPHTDGEFRPHRPMAVKTKKGWRLFPAQRISYHDMGQDIGDEIRAYRAKLRNESGTHASPRPHVRRAHWHGYWHGAKKVGEDGQQPERQFKLRWLPPIPVAMRDDDEG